METNISAMWLRKNFYSEMITLLYTESSNLILSLIAVAVLGRRKSATPPEFLALRPQFGV